MRLPSESICVEHGRTGVDILHSSQPWFSRNVSLLKHSAIRRVWCYRRSQLSLRETRKFGTRVPFAHRQKPPRSSRAPHVQPICRRAKSDPILRGMKNTYNAGFITLKNSATGTWTKRREHKTSIDYQLVCPAFSSVFLSSAQSCCFSTQTPTNLPSYLSLSGFINYGHQQRSSRGDFRTAERTNASQGHIQM